MAADYKPAALVAMRNENMRIASGDKRLLALIYELSDAVGFGGGEGICCCCVFSRFGGGLAGFVLIFSL